MRVAGKSPKSSRTGFPKNLGWVERSDTHQLPFAKMMGFRKKRYPSIAARRWGNGPAGTEQAARSLRRYLVARSRAACLARWRSSLRLMVSIQRSRASPLQASSRDDHELLCRNRRIIGMLERVYFGRERQDRAGGEGAERAGCADRLVRFARIWPRADRTGSRPPVAVVVCGDEASRPCRRAVGDPTREKCLQDDAGEDGSQGRARHR